MSKESHFEQNPYSPEAFHEPAVEGACIVDGRKILESWFIPDNPEYIRPSYSIEWKLETDDKKLINAIEKMLSIYEKTSPEQVAEENKRHSTYFRGKSPEESQRTADVKRFRLDRGDPDFKNRDYPTYLRPLDPKQFESWKRDYATYIKLYTGIGSILWKIKPGKLSVHLRRDLPTEPLVDLITETSSGSIPKETAESFIKEVIAQVDEYVLGK